MPPEPTRIARTSEEIRPRANSRGVMRARRPVGRLPTLLVLALLLGGGVYYAFSEHVITASPGTQVGGVVSEKEEIIKVVRELIALPGREVPAYGVITDPMQLVGQPFFKNARRDDVVLVFTSAKRAVLFRPSTGQIIEMMTFETPPAFQ